MDAKKSLDFIEWELLRKPVVISNISEATYIKPHPEEIEITRDDEYQIILKLSGNNCKLGDKPPDRNSRLSETIHGEDLSGWIKESYLNGRIEIKGAFQGRYTTRGDGSFEAYGSTHKIIYDPLAYFREKEYFEEPIVNKVIQYCISAPDISIMEAVGAKKELKVQANIAWQIPESKNSKFWNYQTTSSENGWSRCGLFFQTKDNEFLISTRVKETSIEAPLPMSIHYLNSDLATDDDYRKKVVDTFCFIFGRKILPVGVGFFDEKHSLIRSESSTFYSTNFKREIQKTSFPSWFYDSMGYPLQYQQSEANKLFALFWDSYEKYNLRDIMIDYWAARALPLGPNLVRYSAALEGLVNNWFKVNKEKYSSNYIDKQNFLETISPFIEILKSKELENKDWEKIRVKLEQSNSLGSRDKLNLFFNLLGLETTKVEKETLRSRNSYAHGANYSTENIYRVVRLSYSFMTLFHRSLLKVIGYEGKYIDYSAYNFPTKELHEPLGGPENDGHPFGKNK